MTLDKIQQRQNEPYILTRDKIQRRQKDSYNYILFIIGISNLYAYFIPLQSKSGDEVAKALESILEMNCYKKIQTDRDGEFVNPQIMKVLLKYNTIPYHSLGPIKTILGERLIITIRLLSSRNCILKNTTIFIHDFDKIQLIYNQRPYQSLSNSTPLEVHLGYGKILNTFLKQHFNEEAKEMKKKKFNVADTV